MNDLRRWLNVVLREAADVDRLWLGPDNSVIRLDLDDSHSRYVVEHPQTFGLTDEILADATREWREEGGELDYDWIITRAEANGWVRISGDASYQGVIAISSSNVRNILRGIRWLRAQGTDLTRVQVEIETLRGSEVERRFYDLHGDTLAAFERRGVLPRPFQESRLSEAHAMLPTWWRQGHVLSGNDLNRLDASEFIEGDEFDYEWRLCRVPVRLLPTLTDADIAEMDRREPGNMDGIREWLRGHGGEALREYPLVALLTSQGISLLDGWHRATAAAELGWQEMYAAVGLGERTD